MVAGAMLFLAGLAPSRGLAAEPVRLTVEPERIEVRPGETVGLRVGLQDAQGRPAAADRDFEIELSVGGENGRSVDVRLREGETEAELEIDAGQPGVLELRAKHPELRYGGAFLRVKEAGPEAVAADRSMTILRMETDRAVLPDDAGVKEAPDAEARSWQPAFGEAAEDEVPEEPAAEEGETSRERRLEAITWPVRDVAIGMGRSRVVEQAFELPEPKLDPQPAQPEMEPKLWIRATPQRNLLATGEDASTIYAFLGGDNHTGYQIRLVPDTGHLEPMPLLLPRGETTATARLTASRPGKVKVEFLGAQPNLEPIGERSLEVDFEPPITGLELLVPSQIRLGETVEVVAQLSGPGGEPIATDRERVVSFSLLSGRARLLEKSPTIATGASGATAELTGDWWGDAEVRAFTPNLRAEPGTVEIIFPWDILALTFLGSLAGGFIAWTHGRNKRKLLWQRLFTGLVAGLVLYWLLLYVRVIPRAALANPFGVFAAAVIGGWLGTEVFDVAARLLGLRKPQPADGG